LVEEGIVISAPSPLRGEGRGEGLPSSAAPGTAPHPNPLPAGEREQLATHADRAARLAKADLVTGMVGEFPELQGLMGGYYAAAQGEHPSVATAIRDHYKPVGQGDDVPTDPVTVAVSLADKLDTIASFFLIDERPTGSKDPFALRRAGLGIIAITVKNSLRYSIYDLFNKSISVSGREHNIGEIVAADYFNDFIVDRLKVQQRESGVRHDLIDAVTMMGGDDDIGGERDLVRLLARVHALQAFVTTEDGANLLAGYKRAANILKKEAPSAPSPLRGEGRGEGLPSSAAPGTAPHPDPLPEGEREKTLSYTPQPAETALMTALDSAEPRATAAIAREDFAAAMAALASLRAPIDAFFDSVIVNDSDPAKRSARLALLERVRAAVHNVADFSKIEG
ncbi:MAG: glycine--tRNA ligase subunit beta, partial [Sphingomonas sp.]